MTLFAGFLEVSPAFSQVRCGAERTDLYVPLLKNKSIAVVANQASGVGKVNLVDTLVRSGISVAKIFCPEHGFRSYADAGKIIRDFTDPATGIPVISLYGKKKAPGAEDLKDVDLLLFDLQDVGVRFYTYISTLAYVMESCAANHIPMMLLDRPNPNGFYVDGPVLDPACASFVGMHPVPIVYGMTIGEYAGMVNGEGWLKDGTICELQVIPLENYTHRTRYTLPVPPSPALRNMNAVALYPSLCLFEGTHISVGRGTGFPFEVFGHPDMPGCTFSFVPEKSGTSGSDPLWAGQTCYGYDLRKIYAEDPTLYGKINLSWLILAFKNLGGDPGFFTRFFDNLAGNTTLRQDILSGKDSGQIRESWKEDLNRFLQVRKKYLIYPE